MEATIKTLETGIGNATSFIEEKIGAIQKKQEESKTDGDKLNTIERRIYILEKRRLGSDFCVLCEIEFKAGTEKRQKGKGNSSFRHFTFKNMFFVYIEG